VNFGLPFGHELRAEWLRAEWRKPDTEEERVKKVTNVTLLKRAILILIMILLLIANYTIQPFPWYSM
jgi:hypothetical protein